MAQTNTILFTTHRVCLAYSIVLVYLIVARYELSNCPEGFFYNLFFADSPPVFRRFFRPTKFTLGVVHRVVIAMLLGTFEPHAHMP